MINDVVPEQITLFLIRFVISVLMIHFYVNEKKARFLSLFIGFFVFSLTPIFRMFEMKIPFFVYLSSITAFFGLAVIIMGVAVYFFTLSKRHHNQLFIVFGLFLAMLFFPHLDRPRLITAYFQLAILLWIVLVIVFHYQFFQKKVGPNAWLLFSSILIGVFPLLMMVITFNRSLYGEHFYYTGAGFASLLLGFFIINLETFTSKKELLANELKFRHFFDEAPLGYQSLDEQGHLLDVNDTWLQLLGYKKEQVLGTWFGDFLEPSLVPVFQTRFPLFKEKGVIQTEFTMKRSDGTYRMIAFDGRVSYNQEGHFVRTHCVMKDITEQRKLEEELKKIEWMLRHNPDLKIDTTLPDLSQLNKEGLLLHYIGKDILMDEAKDYLNRLESATIIVERNGDFALGLFQSEWCKIMHQETRKLCGTDDLIECIHSKKWLCYESCLKPAKKAMEENRIVDEVCDGGIHLYNVPICSGEEVIGCMNIAYGEPPRDPVQIKRIAQAYQLDEAILSQASQAYKSRPSYIYHNTKKRVELSAKLLGAIYEQKRSREKVIQFNKELEEKVKKRTITLERANQDLENVAYSIAHDLKAPLRAITGFSELLKESFPDDFSAEGRRFVAIIENNAKKMDSLINDLLLLARIARSELKKVNFQLEPIISQVFTELLEKHHLDSLPLSLKTLPEVFGDPSFIRTVVRNLLDNAIKYSIPNQSRLITITGEQNEMNTVIEIKDIGIGFNPAYSNKLFQIFQHLHHPESFPGNGIGLSVVEKIIQKHGGKVWAESLEGKGATFYFSLPYQKISFH